MKHLAIERILNHIEQRALDLTTPYSNWIKLAFALASQGESGRPYFHRLSRFHPEYDPAECDLQFTRCLESKNSGINLGSFFHMAREAGIPLSGDPASEERNISGEEDYSEADLLEEETKYQKEPERLPTLPEDIYGQLPDFLKKVVEPAESAEERDVLLLGSLASLSACLPTVYGIYDGMEVYSNIYLFVTAAASSGKGKLNLCKRLVLPIHMQHRKEAQEMRAIYEEFEGKENSGEKPEKPKEKMLLLPANSSATGLFQLLADNNGRGLIFETEGDTLSTILKSEYGNYSDGYRKAFHHETISFYRRTEREYVDLQSPCLSTVLSGTPGQVHGLIPNAENGLFSRFLFYHLEMDLTWKDTFRNQNEKDLLDYYHQLGQQFFKFHENLCKQPPTPVQLTDTQKELFYEYFRTAQGRYHALVEDAFVATVRRMGLICFRLIMILTALRHLDQDHLPYKLICLDEDFNSAIRISETLLQHSHQAYNRLPNTKELDPKANLRISLLKSLPAEFMTKEFLRKAAALKIPRSTAFRILKLFIREKLVIKNVHNNYQVENPQNIWGGQFSVN